MASPGWGKGVIELADGTRVEAICPIIISASRATDIPAYFSPWFRNRLQAGYLCWSNPFNATQRQYVSFEETRVIVFWSKNPRPLIAYLPEIDAAGINYYFQFTLNDYEQEHLEPGIPPFQQRVDTFRSLAERLGKKRVIWRYDPLLLTDSLTVDVLLDRIARIATLLRDHTEKLVISFADISNYRKVRNNLGKMPMRFREFTPDLMTELAERLMTLNREWGLKIATCAEGIDLEKIGIEHNRCIDDGLLIELFKDDRALMDFLGYRPGLFGGTHRTDLKDKGQRRECGCIISKDIGRYDTCLHLCTYCYANTSARVVEINHRKHRQESESLIE